MAADGQRPFPLPSLLMSAFHACNDVHRAKYHELDVERVDIQRCCESLFEIMKLNTEVDRFEPAGDLQSMCDKMHPDTFKDIIDDAAHHGHIDCLRRAHAIGVPWPSLFHLGTQKNKTSGCASAAGAGQLECLVYLFENHCPWNRQTCYEASRNGHLECLRYAVANGCPMYMCYPAAQNGHLDCLVYLFENGCLADVYTCFEAARNGHIDCLRYAYDNGFHWSIHDVKQHAFAATKTSVSKFAHQILRRLLYERLNHHPTLFETCSYQN